MMEETKPSTDHHQNKKKKLKLFGIELNPSTSGGDNDRSNNSSSDSSTATDDKSSTGENSKKLECQYCSKVFGNSQALGGHQNAHKKERMKKKRLQLIQDRKSSFFNHYNNISQPWFHESGSNNSNNSHYYVNYHYSGEYYCNDPQTTWVYNPCKFNNTPPPPPEEIGVGIDGHNDATLTACLDEPREKLRPSDHPHLNKGYGRNRGLDLHLGLG